MKGSTLNLKTLRVKGKPLKGLIKLSTETVEGTTLPLESIDDIHGGDRLPLSVFCVGDCIPDDIFKEDLQDTTSLFVDEARDTLHTSTTGQSTNGWLGDTLDVVTKYFAMTLGSSFTKTFSSFTATSHDET